MNSPYLFVNNMFNVCNKSCIKTKSIKLKNRVGFFLSYSGGKVKLLIKSDIFTSVWSTYYYYITCVLNINMYCYSYAHEFSVKNSFLIRNSFG